MRTLKWIIAATMILSGSTALAGGMNNGECIHAPNENPEAVEYRVSRDINSSKKKKKDRKNRRVKANQ